MEVILGLFLTVAEFSLFPIIWAFVQRDTISAKKYRWICFGVNLAINLVFNIVITSSAAGYYSAAYLLWTFVFTSVGVKILNSRNLLQSDNKEVIAYCSKCGILASYDGGSASCPQCKQKLEVTTISAGKWSTLSKEEKRYYLDSWGVKKLNAEPYAQISQEKQPQKEPSTEDFDEDRAMFFCPQCDKLWRSENAMNGCCPLCKSKVTNIGLSPKTWFALPDKEKTSLANRWRKANTNLSAASKRTVTSDEEKNTPLERAIPPTKNTVFFCRKCGARIPSDSVFCQKCGEKVIHIW